MKIDVHLTYIVGQYFNGEDGALPYFHQFGDKCTSVEDAWKLLMRAEREDRYGDYVIVVDPHIT